MSNESEKSSISIFRPGNFRALLANIEKEFDFLDRASIKGRDEAAQKELNEFVGEIGNTLTYARQMEDELSAEDAQKFEQLLPSVTSILKRLKLDDPVALHELTGWREFHDFVRATAKKAGLEDPYKKLKLKLDKMQNAVNWAKWAAIVGAVASAVSAIVAVIRLIYRI